MKSRLLAWRRRRPRVAFGVRYVVSGGKASRVAFLVTVSPPDDERHRITLNLSHELPGQSMLIDYLRWIEAIPRRRPRRAREDGRKR